MFRLRAGLFTLFLVAVTASLGLSDDKASVKPPTPRDYAAPGGVGPARGWYIWQKFDPDTWEVEVRREGDPKSWKARVLPYATTYRYLTYGARPDELLAGERVNLFFAPDDKSRWGYVCHFQDELSQMKGHNHAWQVRSVADAGNQFAASLWMGNEKKLDDKELTFELDPRCKKWHGGKAVAQFPLKAEDRIYATWVLRKDQRVVLMIADAASLEALKKEEQERVAKQIAAEGVAGQVEAVKDSTVQLLIFATYWAQMRDFKPGQAVQLRAAEKGFRPGADSIELKLVSSKTGGPYGSGPTDVVLELQRPADAERVKAWVSKPVVRLSMKPGKK